MVKVSYGANMVSIIAIRVAESESVGVGGFWVESESESESEKCNKLESESESELKTRLRLLKLLTGKRQYICSQFVKRKKKMFPVPSHFENELFSACPYFFPQRSCQRKGHFGPSCTSQP